MCIRLTRPAFTGLVFPIFSVFTLFSGKNAAFTGRSNLPQSQNCPRQRRILPRRDLQVDCRTFRNRHRPPIPLKHLGIIRHIHQPPLPPQSLIPLQQPVQLKTLRRLRLIQPPPIHRLTDPSLPASPLQCRRFRHARQCPSHLFRHLKNLPNHRLRRQRPRRIMHRHPPRCLLHPRQRLQTQHHRLPPLPPPFHQQQLPPIHDLTQMLRIRVKPLPPRHNHNSRNIPPPRKQPHRPLQNTSPIQIHQQFIPATKPRATPRRRHHHTKRICFRNHIQLTHIPHKYPANPPTRHAHDQIFPDFALR